MNLSRLERACNTASGLIERNDLTPLERRVVGAWFEELNEFAQHSVGLGWRVEISDSLVVPGQKVELGFAVRAGRHYPIDSLRLTLNLREGCSSEPSGILTVGHVKKNEEVTLATKLHVPRDARTTLPKAKHLYETERAIPFGLARVDYSVGGSWFRSELPLEIEVAPRHVLSVYPKKAYVSETGCNLNYRMTNHGGSKTAGRIRVRTPTGWFAESVEFVIPHEDGSAGGTIRISPSGTIEQGEFPIVFETDWSRDTVNVFSFPLEVPRTLSLGIVESYDNTLENACLQLGVRYRKLYESDLLNSDLPRFHTILIDMRAYHVRPDLVKANHRLLTYVRKGGNLVVLYQKETDWKPDYAPYPIELSRRRVADESAPIIVLKPDHPLLQYPNRIQEEDWHRWVHERGLYFPRSHASEYEQLLACADSGEPVLKTGYLVAEYGKGSYIYTTLSWYRQIREAHAGALRSFVNMISYGLRDSRKGDY